jgi:signal transduction histidine kinase
MAPARGSLSRRLAISFAAVAAITALLAGVILTNVWNRQFDQYVREGLQETADGAAALLEESYIAYGNQWTVEAFVQLPRFGMMSGLGLQVLAPDGQILYDDRFHGAAMRGEIIPPQASLNEPEGPTVTSSVVVDDEVVGSVRVWSFSPEGFLSENDAQFQRASFIGLLVAALIAVAAATAAGAMFARSLLRPIDEITATAAAMRSGNRSARTKMAGDDAIGMLGRTFDEMADAIEADRELERRLTADVAHELRTPLQAIQATVEAMQDGVLPADEEHLGIVRDETMRLSRLAHGILELTRLERGSIEFRRERFNPTEPVTSAIDAHQALLEAAGLTLATDFAQGLLVTGDRDRLTQAVGNLLSNAARYTDEGGNVTVRVRRDTDRAVIEVADTGVGIDENDLDRVFSRFWRADDARDRASGGLGIGLSVVREIVERHEGYVSVSRREGGGSVFAVHLPLARR